MNILLYGPPGFGKTEFANQLGTLLDKTVLKLAGSDLLDKYVGETEKRIAQAFDKANTEETILLFDEVDSFLGARSADNRRWENSMVNEMLMQMERFQGVLVCTTNRMEDLDAAVLRRFDAKVGFDYLQPEQALTMLTAIFKHYKVTKPQDKAFKSSVLKLTHLAPGDFAVAARKTRLTGCRDNPHAWLQVLAEECSLKPDAPKQHIGFLQ